MFKNPMMQVPQQSSYNQPQGEKIPSISQAFGMQQKQQMFQQESSESEQNQYQQFQQYQMYQQMQMQQLQGSNSMPSG